MSITESLIPETFSPQAYPLYAWLSMPTVYAESRTEITEITWQRLKFLIVGWGTYQGHIEPMVWYGNGFTTVPLNCITQDYHDAPYMEENLSWEEVRDWFGDASILIDIGVSEPGSPAYEAQQQKWEKINRLLFAREGAELFREIPEGETVSTKCYRVSHLGDGGG